MPENPGPQRPQFTTIRPEVVEKQIAGLGMEIINLQSQILTAGEAIKKMAEMEQKKTEAFKALIEGIENYINTLGDSGKNELIGDILKMVNNSKAAAGIEPIPKK